MQRYPTFSIFFKELLLVDLLEQASSGLKVKTILNILSIVYNFYKNTLGLMYMTRVSFDSSTT